MQWTIFSFQMQTLVLFPKICYCSIKLQFLFVGDKGVKQLFLSPQTRTLHMLFTHCSQFFWDTLNFSGLFFTSFSFSFFLSLTHTRFSRPIPPSIFSHLCFVFSLILSVYCFYFFTVWPVLFSIIVLLSPRLSSVSFALSLSLYISLRISVVRKENWDPRVSNVFLPPMDAPLSSKYFFHSVQSANYTSCQAAKCWTCNAHHRIKYFFRIT